MSRIPFIYNLRSMKARWVSTLVAVLSIASVVAVFLAVLSMARGFQETVKISGSEENAIILRGGALSEIQSALTLEQVRIIGDAAGVARDESGNPLITPEVVVDVSLTRKSTDIEASVILRGVSKKAFEIRKKVKLIQGRFFKPGLTELVVGKNAAVFYNNLNLGDSLLLGGQTWNVVGIFDAGGSSFDSEIWCDANVVNQTFKRPTNIYQSVTAKLSSVDTFNKFKDALTVDPRLSISVERESTYYENQSKPLTTFIRAIGFMVAIVMSIGAVFAALNTMYAAVSGHLQLRFLAES